MSTEFSCALAQPSIEVTRVIHYPIERVWSAWIDPVKFASWWPGNQFEATDISADVRPGGAFRWGLRNPATGDTYMASGIYREIVEQERFVLSWDSQHNDDMYLRDAQVTINFRAIDAASTEVCIFHEFLNEAIQCSDYSKGWAAAFLNLAEHLGDGTGAIEAALNDPVRCIQLSIDIAAERSTVWQWMTDTDMLARWFPSSAEMDAQAGGSYHFRFLTKNDVCHDRSGAITAVDEGQRVELVWYPTDWDPASGDLQDWQAASATQVIWTLESLPGETDSTRVTIEHRGWGYGELWDDMFKGHSEGWQTYITNLREVMEGREDIRGRR